MATRKSLKKTAEEIKENTTEVDGVLVDNEVSETKEVKTSTKKKKKEEESDSDVIVTEDVKSVPMQTQNNVKNTKAKFLKDYHCVVGGKYYDFKKGKTYTIPTNVKMVVAKANGVLDPM